MIGKFNGRFFKDMDKLNQPSVKSDILDVIEEVEKAANPLEIKKIKSRV